MFMMNSTRIHVISMHTAKEKSLHSVFEKPHTLEIVSTKKCSSQKAILLLGFIHRRVASSRVISHIAHHVRFLFIVKNIMGYQPAAFKGIVFGHSFILLAGLARMLS